MSSFQPIDTKLDAAANALFLTLDDGASGSSSFRSLGAQAFAHDSSAAAAAPFFQSDLTAEVFRSVGAEGSHGGSLAMPAFGAGGVGVSSGSRVQRSDFGAASDDEASSADELSAAATFWHGAGAPAGVAAVQHLKSLALPSVVSAAAVDVDEAPAYYERHSSFLTAAAPTDVLLAIAQQLEQNAIDFTYSPNKLKIRGCVLANAVAANFVVRVWRASAASAYLVEFQRRSGCVVAFTNFYRAITQALSHLIMGKAKAAPAVATASVPFEVQLNACEPRAITVAPATSSSALDAASSSSSSSSAADCSVTLDEASFAALSDMAASQDAVCAAEAMRVLGRAVAGSAANQQFVALHRDRSALTVSTLARAVRSPNAYLQMLAVRLVTSLVAATALAADSAVRAALLQLLPQSTSSSSSSSDPLRRETARLVRAVQPSTASSSSAVIATDKLALPALKAVSAASAVAAGKQLPAVLPAFGAASSALTLADVDNAFAARHGDAF